MQSKQSKQSKQNIQQLLSEDCFMSTKEKIRRFRKERDDDLSDKRRYQEKERQKYIDEKRKQKRNDVGM